MKTFLILCVIVAVGLATGGVGFLAALLVWVVVGQAELEAKREEARWREKWYGGYK